MCVCVGGGNPMQNEQRFVCQVQNLPHTEKQYFVLSLYLLGFLLQNLHRQHGPARCTISMASVPILAADPSVKLKPSTPYSHSKKKVCTLNPQLAAKNVVVIVRCTSGTYAAFHK